MIREDKDLAFMLQYENVAWYENGLVRILDRRVYPTRIEFVNCHSYIDVAQAIADMVTQSAGPYTAASMGMALAAYECRDMVMDKKISFLKKDFTLIGYPLKSRQEAAYDIVNTIEKCMSTK